MARILVVDDVKFISQMLKAVFEEKGHRVTTASNGVEALEKARAEQPELVLLDIAMPQMDGIEVTRHLKADNATKSIPVIVVSAKNDKSTIAAAYAAGASDFVLKPFNNEILLTKVGDLLGGHRMNFTTEVIRGIPVVTVLLLEFDEPSVQLFKHSLETARGGGGRPMVIDFTRVRKVVAGVAEAVLSVDQELEKQGGRIAAVAPSRALGMKGLRTQVEHRVKVYETVDAAVDDVRKTLGDSKGGIALEAPTKSQQIAARIKDSKNGLVLESRESFTFVRLRRKDLSGDVFGSIGELLPKSAKDVWVDFRDVKEFSASDLGGLGTLAKKLKGDGKNLRLVNPIPILLEALQSAGFGGLVERMDSAGEAGPGPRPSTAASS